MILKARDRSNSSHQERKDKQILLKTLLELIQNNAVIQPLKDASIEDLRPTIPKQKSINPITGEENIISTDYSSYQKYK